MLLRSNAIKFSHKYCGVFNNSVIIIGIVYDPYYIVLIYYRVNHCYYLFKITTLSVYNIQCILCIFT